jgi:signal peptidase I
MRMRAVRRAVAVVAIGVVLAGLTALLLGAVTIVTTSGVSMEPTYHRGDLVIVAGSGSYRVGQIVAYHDHLHDLVVLHRLVGGDPTGYLFKGDHNASVDAVHPARADLIGRAVLHVPLAGRWLRALLSPVSLTVLAAALLTVGGTRRIRRRRRRHPLSHHSAGPRVAGTPLGSLSPTLRASVAGTALVGLLGLGLAAFTWTRPLHQLAPTLQTAAQMRFDYTAAVRPTAAYDGTTVHAPEPVFRRLANTVEVHFDYRGHPGSVTVDAELSTASGWRSTVALAARTSFPTNSYQGAVRLNLSELEHRAQAAAEVTGLPAGPITVAVVPRVTNTDGRSFAPALRLTLTPLQLLLADDPKTLIVLDGAATPGTKSVPRTLMLLHRPFTVARGRMLAIAALLLAALATLSLLVIARLTVPANESAAIRRRYAPLLLPVHPMPTVAGRPVVDVTTFATLARLAERYGLLVLHWTRSAVDTFIVQDENTTYRYRTGTGTRAGALVTNSPSSSLQDAS